MNATPTDRVDPGIEYAATSEAWLRRTLDEILGQIRRLVDVNGCAFQVIDWDERAITAAAAWFATPSVRDAMVPVLNRPYDTERPGLTEAAIEQGRPLLFGTVADWDAAGRLKQRLDERLEPEAARVTWDWYRSSSFIACPVRTAAGRTLGVLAISSSAPQRRLGEAELHVVEVFADLAALALERSELLEREAARAREELMLNAATSEVTRTLDIDGVYRAIVDQAARLTGATHISLARLEPATANLRYVALRGFSERVARSRWRLGEGMIGRVAQTGEPYLSTDEDAERFLKLVVEEEHVASFVHVPIRLGPRMYGVLSAGHTEAGFFDRDDLALMIAFGHAAAGAIANALDFEHERRVAHGLTRGFVSAPAPELAGIELGLVYEPTGKAIGGGDVFGAWSLPGGGTALLIGDVAGKGVEVSGLSSMVRYFVEARASDCDDPAQVLAQTHDLVRGRLPTDSFVSAFLAFIDDDSLRYCNAGHSPVVLVRADGSQEPLMRTGVPLGAEEESRYATERRVFAAGDVLFAATDGLAEARRDGELFRDHRLPALLAEHANRLAPDALVRRLHEDLELWTPQPFDDVVILAARRC